MGMDGYSLLYIKHGDMKNKDVLFYEVALDDVRLNGVDLTIIISRDKELAATEAKHLKAAIEPTEKIKEYRKSLVEIQRKHAKKNSEGNMIMRSVNVGNATVDMPDIESFNDPDGPYAKDFAQLRSKYNGEIEEYDKLVEEFKGKLEDENKSFNPILINYEIIPKDIRSEDMNIIWDLIDKSTLPEHLKR
jgi:hypothetical protein